MTLKKYLRLRTVFDCIITAINFSEGNDNIAEEACKISTSCKVEPPVTPEEVTAVLQYSLVDLIEDMGYDRPVFSKAQEPSPEPSIIKQWLGLR